MNGRQWAVAVLALITAAIIGEWALAVLFDVHNITTAP